MSQVTIQTTLTNADSSPLTNSPDTIVAAAKALVIKYIPGIPQANIFRGIRTLGDEDAVKIPCLMLQMRNIGPKMPTTGKYNTKSPLDFGFYVGDDNSEAAALKGSSLGAIFVKLFSNNALNDISSNPPSAKYKRYEPYWDDSEMSRVEFSPVFKWAKTPGPKYVCAGFFRLTLELMALA